MSLLRPDPAISRAIEAGLEAVFASPIRHADQPLGALHGYRASAGSLFARPSPVGRLDAPAIMDGDRTKWLRTPGRRR